MKSYLLIGMVIFTFFSCNSRARDEKQADKKLDRIKQLIDIELYNDAKKSIDSLHSQFPRLVNKRKIASALKDTIIRHQSYRNMKYCEKVLPQRKLDLDSILKNFRFEKDEEYQDLGNYVYKTHVVELNTNRNYLKAFTDENATLHLVSYLTNVKLKHNAIKIDVNDLNIVSDTSINSNRVFHNFTDAGMYWESLSLKKAEALKVVVFISRNYKSKIKVTLIGQTKSYTYVLSDLDKKAIHETYKFWLVKKDVVQLEMELLKAKIKIENINLRYKI